MTTDTSTDLPVLQPRVDILASAATIRVRADLPGVPTDALELSLHEGALHIDGVAHQHRFRRAIPIQWPIDRAADVDATLQDGLLTVDLRRADAPAEPRRIAIG